jgi:hypothetical protein
MQSKKNIIKKNFMQTNVTFYFLYLLEPTKPYREKFDILSDEVRNSTENLTELYKDFIGKPVNDLEEWCKLEKDLPLFNWEEVQGKDRERFLEFLKQEFDISWVETATIDKINKVFNKNITVTAEKNYLSLGLNNKKNKVNIKIDDGRSVELIAKSENGKLNIYGDKWEVKYYKERIILKVKTNINAEDLNDLFRKAKKKRTKLLDNNLVKLEDIQKQLREKCKKFLFSWDNIPGNDTHNLKDFLDRNFGIEWIKKDVQIKKSDNQIKIFHEKNYLYLKRNVYNPKVKLEIDDGRTYEFIYLKGKQKICCECIQSVYMYPLIEVDKEYQRAEFDSEDDAITTFFYEIPDVGYNNRFLLIFPYKYRKVLMRVSGPSVMTTKMSDIMRSKLINMLYESALYKMRESERESNYCTDCKKIFGSNYEYLRKYIAEIFFSIESGSSGIETGSKFEILSFISAFGALASILAISYAVYILPSTLKIFKTSLSLLLLVLTFSMLGLIVGRDYSKMKKLLILFFSIIVILGLFGVIYYFNKYVLLNLK